MANIKADEITQLLRQQIENYYGRYCPEEQFSKLVRDFHRQIGGASKLLAICAESGRECYSPACF